MMEEAFRLIDDPDGESTYLRLSTRSDRAGRTRPTTAGAKARSHGGYWLRAPGPNAEAAIVAMGAVMPEALAAWEELADDVPGLGLLAVTSPDLLHRGWTAAQAARWQASASRATSSSLLSAPAAARRPRHHRRRRARLAVMARRRARPARRAARRREVRPDRQPRRPLCRLPPRRLRDHRRPLPSCCCLPRGAAWPGVISTSGRSATASSHAITRTVTETDNVLITTLTHNPQPLHLDYEAAAKSEFGKPLVNSCFTFSLMVGVSVARHDARHARRQPRLRQARLSQPGLRRRHAAQRKRVHRAARKQVAAERRHRHLGAPQLQPARRAGVRMHPHRAAAQKAAMTEPRSWLFVPADSERKIAKALDSDADAIIFDLEDSVAPAQKAAAREILKGPAEARPAARNGGCASTRSAASITRTTSRLIGIADIHGIVLPKAESGADVDPARASHRQHPDPRDRHRNRGEPVRPAVLSRPEVAAGGDELGRGGSVGRARRLVQI